MDTNKARETLRAMYEGASALWEGRKSADDLPMDVHSFFSPDAKLHNPESTPWGGVRIGGEIPASMPTVQARIGSRKIVVRSILVEGLEALVLIDLEYANNADDATAMTTVAEYFRFNEDGQVVEVLPHFFDTAAMLAFKDGTGTGITSVSAP